MNPRIFHLSAICTTLFSSYAAAVGFGEITLRSKVGEPLHAEVPIIASADEQIDTACFSLAPLRNADLPVISDARIRLARNGQEYRLYITGIKPIDEPIFIVGLRANCGVDLQRDYVLMPPPPLVLAETSSLAPATTAVPLPRKVANIRNWSASEGDTLESIAEAQIPESSTERQRLLIAMQRANPNLASDQPLAEGTAVRIPKLRKPVAASETIGEAPSRPRTAERVAASPPKKDISHETEQTPAGSTDRLVLGAAPEELNPGEKAVAPRGSMRDMEERMLKLETTLSLLNQEMEKLDSALALSAEATELQQKLQAAQAATESTTIKLAPPAPAPVPATAHPDNWTELLISALIGGGIAAGIAQLLGRRRREQSDENLPLTGATYQQQIEPKPQPDLTPAIVAPPPVVPPSPTLATVDIPLAMTRQADPMDGEAVRVDYNDSDSALELAEIMVSFGRVRGAAETLSQHIEDSSPGNIKPWTMLLDLYRRGGMQAEFDNLAAATRQRFNVAVPTWEASSTPVSGLRSLEDYPHIIGHIVQCWGKQEAMDYLDELVHDNRAGERSGFPLEVIEQFALLMRILEDGYRLKRPA